jgi:transcriptional regulator with XRE-family HTH domain
MQYIKHVITVLIIHNVLNIDNPVACVYKYCMDVEALYRHIGATIKRKRKQLGLTQEQLATRMATSRASLANVETGRQNVLVHQLYSFAAMLDLKIEDLLPPVVDADSASSPSDFPLPKDLNRVQREQITRLLDGAPVAVATLKEGTNVRQAKRRSTG